MSYGLRIWNAGGSVSLDVIDRITRSILTSTVTLAPDTQIFVAVSGMTTDGTWSIIPPESFVEATVQTGGILVKNHMLDPITTVIEVIRL